jgi:hypothetical protein
MHFVVFFKARCLFVCNFTFSLILGYDYVHETRIVWNFVIFHCFGATISEESILKHAASDAFVGNSVGLYMHIIGVYQEIYIQFSWRYLVYDIESISNLLHRTYGVAYCWFNTVPDHEGRIGVRLVQ